MANLQEFINYLLENVDKSIYVIGSQGQYITKDGIVYDNKHEKIINKNAEDWIRSRESSSVNAERAIKLYRKRKEMFDEFRAFDCSGMLMFWICDLKHIVANDMTANGIYGKCKKYSQPSDIRKGDFVFRVYTSGSNKGRAHHIGYVVDDKLNVVESRGRDAGVVKLPFDSNYWNAYGVSPYFEEDTDPNMTFVNLFTRVLKKTTPMMTGTDVLALQGLLNLVADAGLAMDGEFGKKTETAVINYQKAKGLKADGKAGKNTITALGGNWIDVGDSDMSPDDLVISVPEEPEPAEEPVVEPKPNESKKEEPVGFVFARELGLMQGDDVKELQTALNNAGLSVGTADGIFGTNTQSAVKKFQNANGLAQTGIADKETIIALGLNWIEQ